MKKKYSLKNYQNAIEFIEYLSLSLESGHNIQDAFLLSTTYIEEGFFYAQCIEVIKSYQLGISFSQSLLKASKSAKCNIASEVFENIYTSLKMGTQLTTMIKEMSAQLRLKSIASLEEMAHEAPIKMIFPLVIFIFPVLFILLGTKTLMNFIQSLGA